MRLGEIISVLDEACPEGLAAEWDNVGLLAGDPESEVRRVVVALDPDADTLSRSLDEGGDLLVTHHPLFREPPRSFTPSDPDAARIMTVVRGGLAVYCMHTNFDALEGGVSDVLAERLGLEGTAVLSASGAKKKIVVFVPPDSADRVAKAMAAAGAGRIGAYRDCSFRVSGTGTFTAPEGARPAEGKAGAYNAVGEIRLEMVLPSERLSEVERAMRSVHPYEEAAYDVYDLVGGRPDVGFGRVGTLHRSTTLSEFAAQCGERLGVETVKYAGEPDSAVWKIAVCGGSGGGLIDSARRRGADVLVAGDIRYHEAQRALGMGLAIVDAGHDATEAPAVEALAALVKDAITAAGYPGDMAVYHKMQGFWKAAGGSGGQTD